MNLSLCKIIIFADITEVPYAIHRANEHLFGLLKTQMMKRYIYLKGLLIFIFISLLCVNANAQFSLTGSDPAAVQWRQIETENFIMIFPKGEDSLARVYGMELEQARQRIAGSSGYLIGQSYKGKMPVVLHSRYVLPNASVTWAPKRMDIFTVNDPYAPTAMPWVRNLTIHEGRHAAQMQFGADRGNKVLHWLFGEMAAGAFAGIYPGPAFLEGDAVVAETALSRSGRGRQAEFLEYMMPAFDCGDWRDYYRWFYGSNKLYTPDYYRVGYMFIAGTRVFFNDPLFTQKYFDRVVHKGWLFNLQKTVKSASGKSFNESFRTIEENFQQLWNIEAAVREPFMPSRQISRTPRMHTEYNGSVLGGDSRIYSLKSGMATPNCLVRLDPNGKEKRIRSFASYTSDLFLDSEGQRIFWSESVSGRRWTLGGSSRIRYVDLSKPGKVQNLTKKGRYFNPAPAEDGKVIAATEYPYAGGSRIVLLDAADGSVRESFTAPDSIQFTESAWIGDRLFAAGLSDNGMGIYEVTGPDSDGKAVLCKLLGPQPVTLSHLRTVPAIEPEVRQGSETTERTKTIKDNNGHFDKLSERSLSLSKHPVSEGTQLSFLCDRTGVTELYSLDVENLKLRQLTSTRYGISSPVFKADTLYYSSLAASDRPRDYKQGRMMYATAVSDLPITEVRYEDIHKYPVADALTAQETALGDSIAVAAEVKFSQPERYSKIRLPHIHSWAPVYFNYDNVESISGDDYYKTASLGATAMFQNLLSTGYGMVGYGAHEDPYKDGDWRHSGHFKYIFTGLYPVIEFSADFNDRAAMDIQKIQVSKEKMYRLYNKGTLTDKPYFEGGLKVYIPFNFSSGGINRGLIPQVKYKFTNDRYNDQILFQHIVKKDGKDVTETYSTIGENNISPLQTLDASIRGYVMRQKAPSQVFPSLGFGAELGFHFRPGHMKAYNPTAYLYTYGYLPGFTARQGLRLTASMEVWYGPYEEGGIMEGALTAIPRGFVDTNLKSIINSCSESRWRVTADYAIPFADVDWSFLSPVAYVKNFELTPFFDWSYQTFSWDHELHYNPGAVTGENLFSVGADLTVNLGNFFWLPYDTQIGIRYARNFWHYIDRFPLSNLNRDYIGWIFSISL